MIFQAAFENYAILVRKSRYEFDKVSGDRIPIPGLWAKFEGPQRICDTDRDAERYEWSKADKELVEKKIVTNERFGKEIFPAFGETLPKKLLDVAVWKPPQKNPKCGEIWLDRDTASPTYGEAVQCQNDRVAGREFCSDHDPKAAKIIRGALTTMDG